VIHAVRFPALLYIAIPTAVVIAMSFWVTYLKDKLRNRSAELTEERQAHKHTKAQLDNCREFIAGLQPRVRKWAGDAAQNGERWAQWEKKALLLSEENRQRSATRQLQAKIEFGLRIVEALLSYVLPHPPKAT